MTPQQFPNIRRRPGTRIEQRHADLATRKRLIEHRQISDDQRNESKPDARLEDDERTRHPTVRYYIAQTQRKQSCATDIQIGAELRPRAGGMQQHHVGKRRMQREVEQSKA